MTSNDRTAPAAGIIEVGEEYIGDLAAFFSWNPRPETLSVISPFGSHLNHFITSSR